MDKIRNEVHTRSKFASQKYYALIRHFVKTNIQIKDGKLLKDFKYLSGIETHLVHRDLERCHKIYIHYRKEYQDTLERINRKSAEQDKKNL